MLGSTALCLDNAVGGHVSTWINSSLAKSLRRRCRNVFIIMMLSFSASSIQECLTVDICFRLAASQRRFLFPASVFFITASKAAAEPRNDWLFFQSRILAHWKVVHHYLSPL